MWWWWLRSHNNTLNCTIWELKLQYVDRIIPSLLVSRDFMSHWHSCMQKIICFFIYHNPKIKSFMFIICQLPLHYPIQIFIATYISKQVHWNKPFVLVEIVSMYYFCGVKKELDGIIVCEKLGSTSPFYNIFYGE